MRIAREELAILSVEAGDHVAGKQMKRRANLLARERKDSLNFIG